MPEYQFRFLDRLKVTVHVEVHEHEDDLAALDRAYRLSSTHSIEIWNDDLMVARIRKGEGAREQASANKNQESRASDP
jgi:hypothetical protein